MRDEHDVQVEKQRTIQELINSVYWLGFWLLVIGGCVADKIVSN